MRATFVVAIRFISSDVDRLAWRQFLDLIQMIYDTFMFWAFPQHVFARRRRLSACEALLHLQGGLLVQVKPMV